MIRCDLSTKMCSQKASTDIVVGRVEDALLTVVYSTPEDDLYRIISARPSTAHERNEYERNLFHP